MQQSHALLAIAKLLDTYLQYWSLRDAATINTLWLQYTIKLYKHMLELKQRVVDKVIDISISQS